jgi:MFS family permease
LVQSNIPGLPGAGQRPFYGYVIIIGTFIISLLTVGAFVSFGIFFKPLSLEHGWTRAITSGADALSYITFGVTGIIAGRLTDKLGPKVVLVTCGIFLGLGYLLMSQVSSIWQLYLFYGLIVGTGMSASDTPVLATVARWFLKKRGMATGITKVGTGIGILSIPILSNWFISSYGWRNAYVWLGVILLIGIVAAALFLKRAPADIGQLPDGDTRVQETDSTITLSRVSLREAVYTRQFWICSAAWFMLAFCVRVVLVHTANNITDQGISATVAATVIGAIGGFSIAGRLGLGIVSDRVGAKSAFLISLFLFSIAFIWVQFAREAWMFYLFALLYGVAHGGFFTVLPLLLAELFGLHALGAIIGAVIFIGTIGGAIGPVLAGRLFDISGNYHTIFWVCLVMSVVTTVLMYSLKPASSTPVYE